MRNFADRLPIDDVLPQFRQTLDAGGNLVLAAPPGAGKTTRTPLVLLDAPWRKDGRIILLEPRRLAARAAAARMAASLGEGVGETVGLRMRLESKISGKTRIEVVTEGVFARMILDDPELGGVACVLFDEFHERSLDADLGLALALDCQSALRDDLRLVAMSATLDDVRVARLMGRGDAPAPVIESAGRAFPVETVYLGRDPAMRIEEAVARAILRAVAEEQGSILAFLPGQAEIRRVASLLEERRLPADVDLAPLYGSLERAEQDRAVAPTARGRRKIVLATSIAETSLTIEGVRIVVDCGLSRVPVFEPDLGLTRLETVRASRANVDQRRGRAGRTEPGVCYRLWEEAATGALPAFATPEMLSADLSGLVLDLAYWGVGDPAALPFLDLPPRPAWAEAVALTKELGALDQESRLTAKGRAIRALPLPPRLASMVFEAAGRGCAGRAAQLAILLSEKGLGGPDPDLSHRLDRLCADNGQRAKDARRLAANWARQAASGGRGEAKAALSDGALLALAFPDRIAKARSGGGEFLMANGRAASLPPEHPLAREGFLAVAEIAGRAAQARILAACALAPDEVEALGAERIEARDETVFDPGSGALRRRRFRRLGAIRLGEQNLAVEASLENARTLARGAATAGVERLPWSRALNQTRDRTAFLRRAEGEEWPDLSDSALALEPEEWLAPFIVGRTSLAGIETADLDAALAALLPYELARRLDAEAPPFFETPAGSRIALDYAASNGPLLSVRVQELFGLARHPSLARGRVPVTLELLSPAHRPIQTTRDLPGFWAGSWSEVKKEMKGRYPRHSWPDDPARAQPTTRAKPRG
ncbi:ATP-dependent helicase HrpB [Methylocystis heyeri]|uniref:ATP-dependent helicase HrpB n=1 Tax=Methylocystis heyeri TaxID=391905 RepID=A0A6B8KGR3_9HYPH|nr:ATP-dependent helicase HrpB [Methylocystis heyeri]QGM46165.1 ATP-dependent helicase HrpB [Methylocystis heyeri]